VQTPQVFRYNLLLEAYEAASPARSGCTDDAMLLERLGLPVATFPGDPRNIKVSTPADLPLVTLFLHDRRKQADMR
jgi:2-C-methyl-D-erythritol 4-phosphate cytidylyltransferase